MKILFITDNCSSVQGRKITRLLEEKKYNVRTAIPQQAQAVLEEKVWDGIVIFLNSTRSIEKILAQVRAEASQNIDTQIVYIRNEALRYTKLSVAHSPEHVAHMMATSHKVLPAKKELQH